MQLPANLNVAGARLPEVYESAKSALANCAKIDECQDWANKAEALASYARQAEDETLRKMADRIQARAVRRCGELLKTYDGRGGDRSKREGTRPSAPSKKGEATKAGLSEHQRKQANNVANLSDEQFETAVESEDPATVTQLAEMGKKTGRSGFKEATHLIGAVKRFSEFCEQNDPAQVAAGVMPHEISRLRAAVATIDGWLDRFVVNLETEK